MSKEGAGCKAGCLIGIADALQNHGFISHDRSLEWAYTLRGDECERKGTLPRPEQGFPGKDATCWPCYREHTALKHGSGAGKSGYDASVEELKDCIKNAALREDYNAFTYNCNDWVKQAQEECGLSCPRYNPFSPHDNEGPFVIPAPKRR